MGHQFPPPAPPPPPAMPQRLFPATDQLGRNFGHTHIETIEPRFETESFGEHRPGGGRGNNPRRASEGMSSAKSLISYEGYIFTKNKAEHAGQKETWAFVRRTSMPISQADMRDQVQKQYKKGVSALKQYEASEMQGFKRRQVDRLIEDRERRDDPNFHYQLASIKLEQRRLRSGKVENGTMRVILKRQLRPGVPVHPAMAPVGPPKPSNELIDMTGQEESERSSVNSFGSSPKLHHGAFPLPRQHSEPWAHVPQVVEEPFMAPHPHGSPHGEEQGRMHNPFFADAHFHGGHGGKEMKDDKDDRHGHGDKPDKKDKKEKSDKIGKQDKKDKTPEIHQSHTHKPDKKHHSDTSSLDSDWDQLSGHTEDTFETFPSTSGGSKTYKETKHHKHDKQGKHDREDRHKSHSHHGSRDREPQRPLYREHTRKVPEKPRDFSPAPSRRSNRSATNYRMEEDVYIQPEVSHRGGRDRQREPRPRQISYSRERPSRRQPQRRMSYDDDFDLEYDEPRSATYIKKVARVPKAPQVNYENERLKLELERERNARERERREKDMLDRELDRTAGELDRATAELHRNAARMQIPVRDRLPPRERRQPPIIDRDFPPMPRPRRVQEPLWDDYDDYDYLAYR